MFQLQNRSDCQESNCQVWNTLICTNLNNCQTPLFLFSSLFSHSLSIFVFGSCFSVLSHLLIFFTFFLYLRPAASLLFSLSPCIHMSCMQSPCDSPFLFPPPHCLGMYTLSNTLICSPHLCLVEGELSFPGRLGGLLGGRGGREGGEGGREKLKKFICSDFSGEQ